MYIKDEQSEMFIDVFVTNLTEISSGESAKKSGGKPVYFAKSAL